MSAEYDPSGCSFKDSTYPPSVKVVDYMDANGAVYFVRDGIGGKSYMTMRDGHRVKSPNLPVRDTREEAQRDLDAYAPRHGLREVV